MMVAVKLPADLAEAPLAQVVVGVVAAAMLLAVLLRLLLSQLVSAFQLHLVDETLNQSVT